MSTSTLVIGAGIMGLCCAEELHQRGHAVTVIDRQSEPPGCSFGNGGIIVPSHFVPIASAGMLRAGIKMMLKPGSAFGLAGIPDLETLGWIAKFMAAAKPAKTAAAMPLLRDLNILSKKLYLELIPKLAFDTGWSTRGLLMLCRTEAALEEERKLAETAGKLGLLTKELSGSELAALEPGVEMKVAGAVHFYDDAHLTPPAFMAALKERLCEAGVRFVSAEVSRIKKDGRTVKSAQTSLGDLTADNYVVAAGAWSGVLARQIGLNMPLLSGKGYGITVGQPPAKLTIPSILTEARVAVTPMLDGVRFVGGLELGHPRPGINPRRVQRMRSAIGEYYPQFDRQAVERSVVWYGHRPCSPDGLPYIGRTDQAENLAFATGHAMMGMSLGPVTGRLVAQCLDGERPDVALDQLSPDRYE